MYRSRTVLEVHIDSDSTDRTGAEVGLLTVMGEPFHKASGESSGSLSAEVVCAFSMLPVGKTFGRLMMMTRESTSCMILGKAIPHSFPLLADPFARIQLNVPIVPVLSWDFDEL